MANAYENDRSSMMHFPKLEREVQIVSDFEATKDLFFLLCLQFWLHAMESRHRPLAHETHGRSETYCFVYLAHAARLCDASLFAL